MTQTPDNIFSPFCFRNPKIFICTTPSTAYPACTTKPTITETPEAMTADHHLDDEDETMITSNNQPNQGSNTEVEGAVEGAVGAEGEGEVADQISTMEG